jgi:hypothetical protein
MFEFARTNNRLQIPTKHGNEAKDRKRDELLSKYRALNAS